MAYSLKGRALSVNVFARCIFCGRRIKHVNDGGSGWMVGARVHGEARYFLYCAVPRCPQLKADSRFEHSIWRCGCVADYVENVGSHCVNCSRERSCAEVAGDDCGGKVHVYTARVIAEEPLLGVRRIEEVVDATFGHHERFVLDDKPVVVPAEEVGMEQWFQEGK